MRLMAEARERPSCPVCGARPWAEQIEISMSDERVPSYVDGYLHCPNRDDPDHVAYWRGQ